MPKTTPPQGRAVHVDISDRLRNNGRQLGVTLFLRRSNVGPVTYLYAASVNVPITLDDLNRRLALMAELCKECGSVGSVTFAHQGDCLRVGRVIVENEMAMPTSSVIIMLYPTIRVAVSRLKQKSPFSSLPFEVPVNEVPGLRSA